MTWTELIAILGLSILVSAAGGLVVGRRTLAHPPMRVLRSIWWIRAKNGSQYEGMSPCTPN